MNIGIVNAQLIIYILAQKSLVMFVMQNVKRNQIPESTRLCYTVLQ